ncbi:MAG: hypothetical protein R3250_17085, partial [Melioribacteraceae bacterium]|nr:hypothetical protein [Melioribacteraceae bacterium]
MKNPLRAWWRNCAIKPDAEISAIDTMEDRVTPLSKNLVKIRELISSLEICHHKSERWIYNIIEAIGQGESTKGLGSSSPDKNNPSIIIWQNICDVLSKWCERSLTKEIESNGNSTIQLVESLREPSPLKVWQVQRVIEKIQSVINWRESIEDPNSQYVMLLINPSEYELSYLNKCPEKYKNDEKFWRSTAKTFIHETENGEASDLSLALAIDMLWPCHKSFLENLKIVLNAIGGNLDTEKPFMACGRNIHFLPNQNRLERFSNTLRLFYEHPDVNLAVDRELLSMLGNHSAE